MTLRAVLVAGLALSSALPASAQTPPRSPRPAPSRPDSPPPVKPDARAALRALEDAFSAVADRVTPAVVNVSTLGARASSSGDDERPAEFFGDELYERYSRRRPREDGRARA